MKGLTMKSKYLFAGLMAVAVMASGASATSLQFGYTGGLQQQEITTSGTYYILLAAAEGGSAAGGLGGGGSLIAGSVNLTAGTVLDLIVGQSGATGNFGTGWGGGGGAGGSFPVD